MYVYAYYNKDSEAIYVGSSQQPLIRFYQHKQDDEWMNQVNSVSVWGPYDGETALTVEKSLISFYKPEYNTNSLDYKLLPKPDFINNHELHFHSIKEFVQYFKAQPDTLERCTFYLRRIDREALRVLGFYYNEDLSLLVRELLSMGIETKAKQLNLTDIYEEASQNLSKRYA